ncbi:MAG TPA: hypothetical protein DF409_11570, partial [Bacteroidales bacterium]|nr:hypothetical protein [Bacteroidales bacterium]
MRNITKRKAWQRWFTTVVALLFAFSVSAQDVLVTESFENAGAMPAGWAKSTILGSDALSFVTSTAHPTGFLASDGSYMVSFAAWSYSSAENRLYQTTPFSAVGYEAITVEFDWLGSSNYSTTDDRVIVQYSIDGTTWNDVQTFLRYDPVDGWYPKTVTLPSGADMQPTLYLGFYFISEYGNDCYLDNVVVTGTSTGPTPVSIQVGSGTSTSSHPFNTLWMDARSQYLFTAAEILAAGGLPGDITSLGLNVSSFNSYMMNGFSIDVQNYSGTTISGFVNTGWTNVYSGSYAVTSNGIHTFNFSSPFNWDGVSSLLVNICFDNTGYGGSSTVFGTAMPGQKYAQYDDLPTGSGCSDPLAYTSSDDFRPNIYLTITPSAILPTGIVQGFVTNGFGVPLPDATVAAQGDNGTFVTTSGPNGAYQIPDITIGTYTMAAGKDGYNTVYINNVLISQDNTTYQNFELPRPAMAVTPNPLSVTLQPNEMHETALNINNNGDGTLNWTAEVVYMEENTLVPGLDPNIPVVDFNSLPATEVSTIGPGNGQALSSRNTMLCPDGSKFSNAPVGSDNGYTSTTSAGYKCYQQFLGVDGNFNILNFWAIFTAAPPATMNFNIEICAAGSTPGTVLTSLNVDAAPVNTGTPVIGYNTYLFTVELPSTAMSEGWISVQATTASPTFYWLNTMTGTGGAYQNAVSLAPERLAMCLSGGGASGWLTLGQYEGIVPRYTNFDNPAYFSAMGTEAG